jgi:hypothetical protein
MAEARVGCVRAAARAADRWGPASNAVTAALAGVSNAVLQQS